ncbi:Hypothetical predicted protein [Paramuricea clavata]|uniref:Uncharacterized protein n=1 Tax=Paramuricea clavata TaxID=317549 RepID=A0A6S7HI27_PARCT|nr:Hypothetical predicted protein [Paramuricea clavata]
MALYDPKSETKIRTDASSYGLGPILMQRQRKDLVCADTLSRSPLMDKGDEDILTGEANGIVDQVLKELPCTEDRLDEFRIRLKQDVVCEQVMKYCTYRLPDKNHVNGAMKPYWQHVDDLAIQDSLLYSMEKD